MTEEEAMAAVGQDEPPRMGELRDLVERTELLVDMVRLLVEQAQAGVLEVRAGEVGRWAHTVGTTFLEVTQALTRWDAVTGGDGCHS